MFSRNVNRIIVTGPTGAIGTAIIKKCIEKKIHVIAITRMSSARNTQIPKSDFVRVFYSDINEYDAINTRDILKDEKEQCDAFIHLAWKGTIGDGRNDVELQMSNVEYTLAAVRLAKRLGCRLFVGAGSQAEYGRVEGYLNSSISVFPETGYGIAKLCAGQMSRLLCGQLGLDHIWLRILSIYGPNDGSMTMVSTAIQKFISGDKTSFTAGEQQWDYLFSEDAAEIILKLFEKGHSGKIYCIGSGKKRMLKEYIHDIYEVVKGHKISDKELGIGELSYGEKQPMFLCADTSELIQDIGEFSFTKFSEGIRKTMEWKMEN